MQTVWARQIVFEQKTRVWMNSFPDARRRKICNRSILEYVRIANFFATPQMGDCSSNHCI